MFTSIIQQTLDKKSIGKPDGKLQLKEDCFGTPYGHFSQWRNTTYRHCEAR